MTRTWTRPLALALPLALLAACGSAPAPAIAPPPPQPAPSPAPVVESPPPVATEAPAAEPTPEEKKKAEEAKELQADRDKWNAEYQTELARWTPDLHAAAKALADKTYPSGHAAIQALMAGKHRVPGAADRDKYRHPLETLDLFGFRPTMTVVDVGPGEGWYTELLAPALAKQGKYYATTADPHGPPDARRTFYAQKFKQFLDKAPEIYGKTQPIVVDGKQPRLGLDGQVDMVIIMRGIHGMVNGNTLGLWLAEIQRALKPGGVLGIEEHRAKDDADPFASAKKGYVPEKWLIDQVQAAGFKLAKKSEVNANPKDTKDYPEGVWSLPPTLEQGDKDRDKYLAIGESDRMTLKFVKAGK